MIPIAEQGPETRSADVVGTNVEALKGLFPEAFTEGRIDFEVLKQLLGGAVEEREEKYGLNWHGKRQARQLALTPSTGTLRPAPGDSVDWDTTQNLMIEGDNLEVLKLLQKSYAGKVKMIYIDPPYNTGNDFVYPDDFRDNLKNYLELTGQIDTENRKMSSNPEGSGRFHTTWLNMVYPRLTLARSLLTEDGVLFISIDDAEVTALRQIIGQIFGDENFLAMFVRRRRMSTGMRETPISPDHEYIVCVARDAQQVKLYGFERREEDFPLKDLRGRYRSTDLTVGMTKEMRPNQWYAIRRSAGAPEYLPPEGRVWRFKPSTMMMHIESGTLSGQKIIRVGECPAPDSRRDWRVTLALKRLIRSRLGLTQRQMMGNLRRLRGLAFLEDSIRKRPKNYASFSAIRFLNIPNRLRSSKALQRCRRGAMI